MKKLLFVLLFCECFVGCSSPLDSKIIFWRYKEKISFEEFCAIQLEDIYKNFEVGLEIPLENFNLYLWDEQILRMDRLVYDNNYFEKFAEIERRSHVQPLYFSIIIKKKIVFKGLNRVTQLLPIMPYMDSKYPRISVWGKNDKYVFFRFSYKPTLENYSIWDIPEELDYGDPKLLFVENIFNYFEASKKIQRGRLDLKSFIEQENLITFPWIFY